MTRLFTIILNFNGGEEIIDCLDSLKNEEANIVVVDNGSTDASVDFLKGLSLRKDSPYQRVKLIKNKENLGFAAGMNVGVKYALKSGAEAVLLLNQDTIVKKGFLEPLLKNQTDIVAPVIKFKRAGEWVYDFGGRVNWWLGRPVHVESVHLGCLLANSSTSKGFFVSAVPPSEESIRPPRRRDLFRGVPLARIEYVSGCAMLIKRPVFEKIGFLDEKFFLYFEDIDFCLRAQKAGFKIAVEPKSVITHKLFEKKKKPLTQHFYHLKSNLIFVNRYLPIYRRPIAYIYLFFLLFKVLWNQR